MFQANNTQAVQAQVQKTEKNYVIQKNDRLELEVYTNQGERLIDPNNFISKEGAEGAAQKPVVNTYLVDQEGLVKLPMVGTINLEGLTIRQAEEILQKEYLKFYKETFVVLKFTNKRVVVLGAPGGQVIPLLHDNMRLTEVLALAKGINNDAKAFNIRVMRGETLFIADLTTFEGYKKNDILIEPGDIVYVEPIRRPLLESLRDYGPVISIITSMTTLLVVLTQL
ncbi:polysaccharide biosynthesis/export family protein [Ohtaekwangia koreensis]|uniref:Polysaccharide export outer membrane protein n=1 Tax=Ohtaekwangia koreensis TaxID=688867 RepID=A0A1T5MND3_9BACT|nr:polysaccharide biosynthesis/export family protein [Ohtaekwangia koreensis]SKC89418.1 polysaccharide export outer membrane protein [Ohtaekwangia koreensis]